MTHLPFIACLATMVAVVQADANTSVSVNSSTGNLILSAGSNAVEVQAVGMSIGTISDLEGSISRCLADVEAQGTLLELAKSDIVANEAAVGVCKAGVASLQEAFDAMAVASTEYEAATDAELLAMNTDLGALTTELSDTKAALLAAQQAIADLEEEVAGSCGGACVSGSFISSTCTKDKQHVCSVCPDKTFSFGGFPHACTPFRTCAVGSYISEAGTASADVVCTPCEKGKTFSLKEDVSECTECSTKCSKDNFVIDTQCTVTADITCKPSFNGFYAQQEVSGFDPGSETNGLMFNSLFAHKKVVLGENNNMEWCMQTEDQKGCQKPGLSFDRSTDAFNPKTGMYTVPEDGIYSVVASVRMDFAKFTLIYLYADINNEYDKFQDVMTGNTADRPMYDNSIGKITSYYHEPAGNYQTMKLSGLYMLKKGATLNIGFDWTRTQGYKNALPWKNAHVHPNTGFGVANLNSLDTTSAFTFRTEKWEGHNTNHNDWRVYTGKAILKSEGDILSTEQTNGLFNLGGDLAENSENKWVYTVPSDGLYKFNLNFVIGCCGGDRLARGTYVVTAICVNSKDEPTKFGQEQCQGVSSIEQDSYRWSGAQLGAFLKLEKGQTVRMGWLPNFDSKGWNVRQQTTFSGIRLGDAPTRDDGKSPNGVVGFHAHKKAEQKVPKGWTNLDNYRASGWHGTTSFWSSGHFNADEGIFTAPESGIYITEAMQRFDGAPSGPTHVFRLATCIDGGNALLSYNSGNGHTMRGDVPGNYFTLSISGMYHMKKGQTARLCVMATTGVTLNSGGWASGGLWSMYLLSKE